MIAGVVGQYRVLERIGSGGMGVVYKALDTRLNRHVAIKTLLDSTTLAGDTITSLRREALAIAAIDHPYICKVYELLESREQAFLVMEFVEGETLAEKLTRGVLSIPETLRYSAEIAEALGEAHAKGIIHRDVKPSNIIITPHRHVKVMDFGIAKVRRDLQVDTDDTVTQPVRPVRAFTPEASELPERAILSCLEKEPAKRTHPSAALTEQLHEIARAMGGPDDRSLSECGPRLRPSTGPLLVAMIAVALLIWGVLLVNSRLNSEKTVAIRKHEPPVTWPSRELDSRISSRPPVDFLPFQSGRTHRHLAAQHEWRRPYGHQRDSTVRYSLQRSARASRVLCDGARGCARRPGTAVGLGSGRMDRARTVHDRNPGREALPACELLMSAPCWHESSVPWPISWAGFVHPQFCKPGVDRFSGCISNENSCAVFI